MKKNTRKLIVEVMTNPENDGINKKQIARKVGVCNSTLRKYLTEEVWEEVRKIRLEIMANSLVDVDNAVLTKALGGDISAAKLIYSRWEEMQENVTNKKSDFSHNDMEEIDEEIARIKVEIANITE